MHPDVITYWEHRNVCLNATARGLVLTEGDKAQVSLSMKEEREYHTYMHADQEILMKQEVNIPVTQQQRELLQQF